VQVKVILEQILLKPLPGHLRRATADRHDGKRDDVDLPARDRPPEIRQAPVRRLALPGNMKRMISLRSGFARFWRFVNSQFAPFAVAGQYP
jgi:hypothetical protein